MAEPRQMWKDAWEKLLLENGSEVERAMMASWWESVSASKGVTVKRVYECSGCGKQNLVALTADVPDIAVRAKAFSEFANQAYGKPEESRTVTVDVGERTLVALQAMSTKELAAVAGVQWDLEAVEAEFKELPPAA